MICPIMSRNNDRGKDWPSISATNSDGFVECQKENCAWWIGLMEIEGVDQHGYKIKNGYVYRCAIAQLAW